MNRGKALVLKTYKEGILVLTADGEFRHLKRRPPLPAPGDEIDLPPAQGARWLPLALAAAVFLAAILPLSALAMRPAAYIALDINPSIELTVGRRGTVTGGDGLNAEGDRLLTEVAVAGLTPAAAVEGLVHQAALDGFLTNRPDDIILLTHVDFSKDSGVALADLEAAARRALEEAGREAFVAVEEASPDELREARAARVSLNKLRLLKKLEKPAPDLKPEKAQVEALKKAGEQGLRQILVEAGKKADEVYKEGRWEGRRKETKEEPGLSRQEGAGAKEEAGTKEQRGTKEEVGTKEQHSTKEEAGTKEQHGTKEEAGTEEQHGTKEEQDTKKEQGALPQKGPKDKEEGNQPPPDREKPPTPPGPKPGREPAAPGNDNPAVPAGPKQGKDVTGRTTEPGAKGGTGKEDGSG